MENSIDGNSIAHAEIERILVQIWSEVLNIGGIRVQDDFLSLGGDSLAAMRCINRIIDVFDVELPLDLFLLQSANINQVAAEILQVRRDPTQIAERETRERDSSGTIDSRS